MRNEAHYSVFPAGSYCLQFLPLGSLDYDKVNTYTITLDCVDNNSPPETATMTVELRLEPNTPPYFASLGSGRRHRLPPALFAADRTHTKDRPFPCQNIGAAGAVCSKQSLEGRISRPDHQLLQLGLHEKSELEQDVPSQSR